LADSLSLAGNSAEALEAIRNALRLNPIPQDLTLAIYGRILYQLERYDEAVAVFKGILERHPDWRISALMLIASSSAADHADARQLVQKYPETRFPAFLIEEQLNFKHKADVEQILAHLAKAGLE
jgi:tetratricopeptide (TPR) repeat protein